MGENFEHRGVRLDLIVPTGFSAFDELIGGGYARRMITQFYGEPGSGKSTFCMLAAVTVIATGRNVVYIDTESFSVERFAQIAGEKTAVFSDFLYLFEPEDFEQQGQMISDASKVLATRDVGLIVLDSATGLYRTNLEHGQQDTVQRLNRQIVVLLGFAKRYNIPVLVTNQVYQGFSPLASLMKEEFLPLGGTGLAHLSKVVLQLERCGTARCVRIVKHHSRPEGGVVQFHISEQGFCVASEGV
ncbi:MAG: DNA repair and recombination protein RadB [Methanomicrobiales archaeon]|jgi:DNA repair protein RadB|nr:DNA repair and recombination protein RadB [Methanomicrobiales archaeon]